MLNELNWKILKSVLEADKPISNKELALSYNVAINTIRKEISLINEDMEKHGFSIISKASIGNYIDIENPKLAEPYIERLNNLYRRNQRMSNQYPNHIYYMVRCCLCSKGNLTAEKFSQELYCSTATIQRDLQIVKKILAAYDLALKNRRGRYGLMVEGNEWNLRQCLIYQHKILKNSINELGFHEAVFKSMFFMLSGENYYELARGELVEHLLEQHDFSLPVLYFPKVIHYIQLSLSRHKYIDNINFTEKQIMRAKNTAEYEFAKALYAGSMLYQNRIVHEKDVLALSMLLLSFESQNHHLKNIPEYSKYYEEVQELIERLAGLWGYGKELFDEMFVEECICYLYTLENQLIFNVYSDGEVSGYVMNHGIRSSDFCIIFARFYKEKHGIKLNETNTLNMFYIFHHHLKKDTYHYYAQRILVISQYGISCAKTLAANIRQGYGNEVQSVTPAEIYEYVDEEQSDFDLLMTDLGMDRCRYLDVYNLPVLLVDFLPFQYRCQELDIYQKKVQLYCERTIIKNNCFYYTNLKSKDAVFQYMAELFEPLGIDKSCLIEHLNENDYFVGMERENGIALLPVLIHDMQQQHFFILINKKSFIWNKKRTQIFICYNRIDSLSTNQMLNGILKKFVHISPEIVDKMIHSDNNPLGLLYPDVDED